MSARTLVRRSASRKSAAAHVIVPEPLESRTLFASVATLSSTGVLTINGTSGNDSLYVTYQISGDKINVIGATTSSGATPALFNRTSVKSIKVTTGDGHDSVSFHSAITAPAHVDGGNGDDNLAGGSGNDTILGGAGYDALTGADGNDTLNAGEGNNNLSGGNGNDSMLAGAGVDRFSGGAGNDTMDGGKGGDTLAGDAGTDTVTYATRTAAITADITESSTEVADDGETGEKDFIRTSVENLIGGSGSDKLTGTTWSLPTAPPSGFSRNNKLVGNGGNDVLTGLDGNDSLVGGLGTDKLIGGTGTDLADYSTHSVAVKITLDGLANDGAVGENDTISADVENATGGSGADTIIGSSANNVLSGGSGNDTIRGGLGNDTLYGHGGLDKLYGEAGDDTFYARSSPADADLVDGGTGTDKAQVDSLDSKVSIDSLIA